MSAPTASRHHADWLSLVEISGPFVSLPVLLRVFSQGLEPRDPTQAKALRAAYEEWQDNLAAPGQQRAWVLHVLTRVLGYPSNQVVEGQALPAGLEAKMPEMGETLRPDLALIGPAGKDASGKAQLLIATYSAEQKLDRPVIGKHWKATPATRMMELLHGAGIPLGLVTNGDQWMLVYAPRGEITGYASWCGALWLDEPITLRAFHSILGVRRFFGVADDSTLLALLKESANDQQEVTDQLGFQVREAVEVLVQSFDAIDKDSNRVLLKGVSPSEQYEAALTIMMRLVFLFSAEERGLLHLGKPLYDNNYAVSTLQEQLQEVADLYGEEVLERRTDAWARLLSSFRAVHGGVKHQDLLMQAYGGSLFDPDRYSFLEGRATGSLWRQTVAEPLGVNNRVVLHLLNSLQRLRIKSGTGGMTETRRISFRALGVEQIGHVYEGLLDHTGVRATETVLGIKGTRNKEHKIPLTTLESLLAQGQEKLIDFLKEETGRSLSALSKTLDEGSLLDEHKLLLASGHDEALLARLRPFANLIREDSFDRPLVVLDGSVHVTAGTTRRSTGTHYTPPSLTEPIVQHTLEPLVYEGPAEGVPREQWKLKSPKAILDLKVCDMAMGSGAFLVQACRYLAERLTEALDNEEKRHPGQVLITPDGKFSEGAPSERIVPADANERIAIARRVVADRCLFGVDINPMAVEMAKLSMWLITVDANRPFTFLDHAFKCGDSLLGITSLEQLENFSLRPDGGKQQAFATLNLRRYIDEARNKREILETMPSDTPEQIAAKAALYAEAEESVAKLHAAADVLIAVELKGLKGRAYDAEREAAADRTIACWTNGLNGLKEYSGQYFEDRKCQHWVLSFPEVMQRGGFDAFVGNPPFLWGMRISTFYGDSFFKFLQYFAGGRVGATDLCAHFLRRSTEMVRPYSTIGMILVDTITQGDTREVALAPLPAKGFEIIRATSSKQWPGSAGVKIVSAYFFRGAWRGLRLLDEAEVCSINTRLLPEAEEISPLPLKDNIGVALNGQYLLGQGFVLSASETANLLKAEPKSEEIIFGYIRGEDINRNPSQIADEKVINFGVRSLDECENKYPLALERVRCLVKPERDLQKDKALREKWWLYARVRPELTEKISGKKRVLVQPFTSKYLTFTFLPSNLVFAHPLVVLNTEKAASFACLQSALHEAWVRKYSSKMGDRIRYGSSDCFDTFPFPEQIDCLEGIGTKYYALRQSILVVRQEGLTSVYNRLHNPSDSSDDIADLRQLQIEIDQAVAEAYGWKDLKLGHDFHKTKKDIRFAISEVARREVLNRLLALNYKRHAEEEAEKAAQPISATAKRGRKPKDTIGQISMDL
jgi:hypothetical protein